MKGQSQIDSQRELELADVQNHFDGTVERLGDSPEIALAALEQR
jgi:hypothetical protein